MEIQHKLVIAAIACATTVLMSTVGYNIMDSHNKVQAHKECLASNERMAEKLTKVDSETLRISSLPTCWLR